MAKIDVVGWQADKARRDARVAAGLCPMCGQPKRAEDQFDSDTCKNNMAQGLPSKEKP